MIHSSLDPALSNVRRTTGALLELADRSTRLRFGCKGPGAPAWLEANGFSLPDGANTARVDAHGVLVARLATSEFLIEPVDGGADRVRPENLSAAAPSYEAATRVRDTRNLLVSSARPLNVYPVARQDRVIAISGPGMHALLRQICSLNFVPLFDACGSRSGPIALTSMIGVGVVAWPRRIEGVSSLMIWLDPSFGHYFWTSLLEVGREMGVSVIGSNNT